MRVYALCKRFLLVLGSVPFVQALMTCKRHCKYTDLCFASSTQIHSSSMKLSKHRKSCIAEHSRQAFSSMSFTLSMAATMPSNIPSSVLDPMKSGILDIGTEVYRDTLCALVPKTQKCTFDLPFSSSIDDPGSGTILFTALTVTAVFWILINSASLFAGSGSQPGDIYPNDKYSASDAERYFGARPLLVWSRGLEILFTRLSLVHPHSLLFTYTIITFETCTHQ